jgi:sulfur carrier protein ThiS
LTRLRESPRIIIRIVREKASPMQIKVNDQSIEIFTGARVGDVLRKYSYAEWTLVRKKEKKVCDRYGHEVGLDGELNGGEILVIKTSDPVEPRS